MKTFRPVKSFLVRTLVLAKTLCSGTDFVTEMEQQERGLYVAGGTMSLILIAGDSNKITTLLRLCGYYQRFGKSLCLYFYGNKKEWELYCFGWIGIC